MRSLSLVALGAAGALAQVASISCNGENYVYNQLAGFSYGVPADATDEFDDTIGGIGSAIALERSTWKKTTTGYNGILYAIPDRGWNTEGTVNYQNRVHRFNLTLINAPDATINMRMPQNIHLTYLDSILLTDPKGTPATGLDCTDTGHASFEGFPPLPVAKYTGNGFGHGGPGGSRICIDSEGLVLGPDGSFWISDEYGPYIYHFNRKGRMIAAIEPPQALVPHRNGSISFSADSPPIYAPGGGSGDDVSPPDPNFGRENNHGFEGLTISDNGEDLYALMQEALVQEGGLDKSTERYTRLLHYNLAMTPPTLVAEYVVRLPFYNSGGPQTAGASELHYISPTQFLVLARDSGAGHGQSTSKSLYRNADVIDISMATDINVHKYNKVTGAIASVDGVLKPGITPAEYCTFLQYNINPQLKRFGAHNGGYQNADLLNEKWESFALGPINPGVADGQFILLSMSDNDFITQNGRLNHGRFHYADSSGFDLDSQILAFNVTLPTSPTT